jgi:hypothetical protein
MITIAYFTSRKDCKVDWFVDSLARFVPVEERHLIQLIFVDRHLWAITPEAGNRYWRRGDLVSLVDPTWHVESRREKFAAAVRGRFEFLHIPVKPCMWQGPFRLTTKDWFCAAQARNTAVIAAKHPYFVGVDDLSVLLPTWWPQVKHAASSGYCVCGAYKKVKDLVVNDGEIVSFTEFLPGVDSRWPHGSDGGIVPWHGSGLYGCSFGVPMELLLKVNGMEELTDGQSAEDYDLGIRLERAGGVFKYNRNMTTYESEEMHAVEPSLPRDKKRMNADRLPPGYTGNPDSDHVMLHRVVHESRFTTLDGKNLRQARDEFQVSQRAMIPIGPTHDWRDGQSLTEL